MNLFNVQHRPDNTRPGLFVPLYKPPLAFRNPHHLLPALSLGWRVVVRLSLSLSRSCRNNRSSPMSDVYVPSSMAPTAPPPTRFSSVNLHRSATAAVVAACFAAGAWAATTSAQATAADDIIIGVRYSTAVVDCDEDIVDKITLQLLMWGWRTVKVYTCVRGLRLATVWFAGTAFSEGLRMRASTLLGRGIGGRGGGRGAARPRRRRCCPLAQRDGRRRRRLAGRIGGVNSRPSLTFGHGRHN
ncbi:unnamed protein product [Ectocarpus sp. 6 AP-2014]